MKKIISLLLILVLVLSVTACSKPTEKDEDNQKQETKEAEKKEKNVEQKEKVLNVGVWFMPEKLDPAHGWSSWYISRAALSENLVTLNENLEIVPQLSDKWEQIDDTTWKFHIRQGVKFSNGKDLTAEAVKKSLERIVEKSERAKINARLESIKVDGEYIIYKTKGPYASLLANLTEPIFSILDADASDEEIAEAPVFTGPYKVIEFNKSEDTTLVKNEFYWDGEVGLDKLYIKLIKDDDTRALALKSGEIDFAQRLNGNAVKQFIDNEDYVVNQKDSLKAHYICLNQEHELLKDLEVRKAISYAIDRESIANITNTNALGAIFPESAGYGYDKIKKQEFNLEEAKRLLKDAGYTDSDGDGIVEKEGKKATFVLHILKKDDYGVIAESVQSQLKKAGIEMTIKIEENGQALRQNKNFGGLLLRSITAPTGDPERFLERTYSSNGTHNYGKYNSEKFNDYLKELSLEFDPEKRKEITIKAQEEVNKDVANIFITSTKNNSVYKKSVKNVTVYSLDYYLITKDVTIEE